MSDSSTGQKQKPKRAGKGLRSWNIRLTNWQIILIALVVIGGRLVFDFSNRIIEGQEKTNEELALEAEIDHLLAEQRDLEVAKAYYSSPAYVEDWAHSEGKMVRSGEKIVIPMYDRPAAPSVSRVAAQPPSNDTQPSLSPWQIWWSLFFDSPVPQGDLP